MKLVTRQFLMWWQDMRVLGQRQRTLYSLLSKYGSPRVPSSTKVIWRVLGRCFIHTTFTSQLRKSELRKPESVITCSKKTCLTFASSRDVIFIVLGSMQTCSPLQKETPSFKVVSHTDILGKIVQNKKTCRPCRNTADPWKTVAWQKHRDALLNILSLDQ